MPLKFRCYRVVLAVAAAGCGNAPDEPLSGPPSRSAALVADIPGYTHGLASSMFQPGPSPSQVSEFGFEKVVGGYGVFATRKSGWAVGIPNADAPATRRPPLVTNGEDHNKRVLAYFLHRGLPSDQVARVNAHATIGQSAATEDLHDVQKAAPTLEWYSSVIARSIQGVPVADSFAVARFNADDEVVSESVFWPPIPAAVVAEAATFRAQLADPARLAVFRAKLPPGLASAAAEVVIRHIPAPYDGPFVAKVSYDVIAQGGMTRVRHFEADGVEFEAPGPPDPKLPGGKAK